MSFGLGLGLTLGGRPTRFSPASLFTGGVQGVWYDPSDVLLNWRTNLLTWTQEFDNAAWTRFQTTVAPNVTTAPDGTASADKLVFDNGVSQPFTIQQSVSSLADNAVVSASVYIKASEITDTVSLQFFNKANTFAGTKRLNLLTGVLTGSEFNCTTSVQNVGNGWYLLQMTGMAVATGATTPNLRIVYGGAASGTGTNGFFIWGAQLELGSTATAYQAITTPEQTYLLYDPQPVLYQDSSGMTPVTAVEQPVGLMLDKSQGLVLGTNGASQDLTTWTKAGTATTPTSTTVTLPGANDYIYIVAGTTAGKAYEIKAVLSGSGTLTLGIYGNATGFAPSSGNITLTSTPTEYTVIRYFQPTDADRRVVIGRIGSATATAATVSSVSVKEIAGNHAYQSVNTGYRPTLKARYNLLTYSQEFDNAAWAIPGGNLLAFGSGSVANATAAPDGTTTADLIVPNTTLGFHSIWQLAVTTVSGASYTASWYVKPNGYTKIAIVENQTTGYETTYDATGAGSVLRQANATGTITALANGWYRITHTSVAGASFRPQLFVLSPSYTSGPVIAATWTPNGTDGVYIWGAQLVTLADNDLINGEYQRVAAATDYNTDPALFPVYLDFDGSNDFMVSNSINFTSTDKVTVWAGVGKDTDAAVGILAELSVNSDANNGSFIVVAPNNVGTTDYGFSLTGNTTARYAASSYTAPCYNILSCLYDINGAGIASEIYPQVDGTVPFLNATGSSAGTGNFGTYPLYLGSRAGSTFFFNGKLFGLIVRGAASTSTEIYQGELWMAGKEDLTLYPDAAFNPLSLFAGGAPGAWYKPSDFYNYMSQLGPELVTNGDFSAGTTGWTLVGAGVSITGGQLVFNAAGATQYALQTVLTVGRWYSITYTVSGYSAGAVRVAAGGTNGVSRTSNGTFTEYLLCTADGGFYVITASGSNTFNIDNVSVQALTGTFSMYQESTGVTPVTAVEQSVGLILDQSKGLVRGTELITGAASAYTGNGTVSTVGDTVTATCTTNGIYGITWLSTFVSNQWVLMTAEVVTNSASKSLLIFPNGNATALAGGTTTGNKSFITLAPTATGSTRCPIFYINGLAGESFSVRLVSIKEVPGNHAFQSTPANCPVLRARYNLLTYSEQFDNAVWVRTGIDAFGSGSVANATTAPDGTTTADFIRPGTVSSSQRFTQNPSPAQTAQTLSLYVKASGYSKVALKESATTGNYASFDLSTGTVLANTAGVGTSITALANSWYRISMTLASAGLCGLQVSVLAPAYTTGDPNSSAFSGDGTSGMFVWGAMLNTGTSAGTYQRIAAATDYATGSAFPVYLAFDGSNDSLATNSIDFTGTDSVFACASVTKLSSAGTSFVMELSSSSDSNNGVFGIGADSSGFEYFFNSRGTTLRQANVDSSAYLAPTTNVLALSADISAPFLYARIDSDTKASSTSSQGTGNYGNYPLYIGSRASASFFFNGRIFDLLVCGALVDYTDIANTEYYMAGEAGLPRTLTYDYVTLDDGDQITTDSGDLIYDQITFT